MLNTPMQRTKTTEIITKGKKRFPGMPKRGGVKKRVAGFRDSA